MKHLNVEGKLLVELDFAVEVLSEFLGFGEFMGEVSLPFDKKFTGESQKNYQFKQLQFKGAIVDFNFILLEKFWFGSMHI
jgi:hypothetical protein